MMQRVSALRSALNCVVSRNSERQASINLLSILGPSALLPSQPCPSSSLQSSERHFAYDVRHTGKPVALSRCLATDSPTAVPPASVLPKFGMYQHLTLCGINPHSPCQGPFIPLSSAQQKVKIGAESRKFHIFLTTTFPALFRAPPCSSPNSSGFHSVRTVPLQLCNSVSPF